MRPFRVILQVAPYVLQQVVHAALLDAGRGGAYETPPDVLIHDGHNGVNAYAVVHCQHLDLAQLAALHDFPVTVAAYGKRAAGDVGTQFRNHLVPMREQPAALAASLPLRAAQHLVEGVRHVAVLHDLLDDMSFSAHSCNFVCYSGLSAFSLWV